MSNIGQISYLAGAVSFALLGVALLTIWRGRFGPLLLLAVVATVAWSVVLSFNALSDALSPAVFFLELLRDATWLVFLISMILGRDESRFPGKLRIYVHSLWLILFLFGAGSMLFGGREVAGVVFIFGFFLMALSGLVVTEQVYRNTVVSERWSVKFLCFALAGVFIFDLILYAKGIMFRGLDPELWQARGFVHVLIAPLIALSASRSAKWSAGLFVSRQVAFYTTSLFGAGLYLLAMAAGGYYVRIWGGQWGTVAQATVVFGGLMLLVVMFFSGQVRARVKVFLNKHFFRYKYDYREEWLRLTRLLSADATEAIPLRDRAIMSVANPVESPAGMLWLVSDSNTIDFAARWNLPEPESVTESCDSEFVTFLARRSWVIDLGEYQRNPALYEHMKIPKWLQDLPAAWLVVPLMQGEELTGFIVLARSRAPQKLTWEDLDLLKTVGRQVAGYLAQERAAGLLAEASQFQAFNRFTAFIMHDLKNLIAQQSLVVKNAAKHKHNPEFIEDAISTVDNSVRRMSRLLDQLRQGEAPDLARRLNLQDLCEEVAGQCAPRMPGVSVDIDTPELEIRASRERLATVLGHVVRNAQDAAGVDGSVSIRLIRQNDNAVIEVVDDGPGMDDRFIRERLFRPFVSTKGSKGMGIGAYQAREFVASAGGKVEVESEVGQGTVFRLVFPEAEARNPDVIQPTGVAQ